MTQERLKELLDYDPETGAFRWRVANSRAVKVGQVAGCIKSDGYAGITVDGRRYMAHRIAWFYVYGQFPKHYIDHKNHIRSDNRLYNLREATPSESAAHRGCWRNGLKGCHLNGRWQARIRKNSKHIHLGYFDTEQEAHEAYMKAAKELFGEFAKAA